MPLAGLRLPAKTPLLLALLLVVTISLSLAWQTRELLLELRATPTTSIQPPTSTPSQSDPNALLPLFGEGAQNSSAPPATNLRLSLLGSFVHRDPQRSAAIIRLDDGKPRRFAVGERIQDGIVLHAVYPERVELERQGRLETLHFPHAGKGSGIAQSSIPDAPVDAEGYDASAEQLEMLQDEEFVQLRERMARLRQEMGSAGIETDASETTPAEAP